MAERPEDLNLPNAIIARIIKEAVPEGVNLSKDARVAISKAASVFVLYATSCSNTLAMKCKRKTINAQDVISAMEDMDFEEFMKPLQQCLVAFRNEQKTKKQATEKKKKDQLPEELVAEQTNQTETNTEVVVSSDDESGGVNGDVGEGDEDVN